MDDLDDNTPGVSADDNGPEATARPARTRAPRGPRRKKAAPSEEKAAETAASDAPAEKPAEAKPKGGDEEEVPRRFSSDDPVDDNRGRDDDERGGGDDSSDSDDNDRGGNGNGGDNGDDDREPHWKNRKGKRGKKGKWKKDRPDRERAPAQPLPPGMEEIKVGELPNPDDFADLAELDASAEVSRASVVSQLHLNELYPLGVAELGAKATEIGAKLEGVPGRRQWLEAIFRAATELDIPLRDHGWLDLTDNGYGFIVHSHVAYRLYPENTYMPASLVKRYGLKRGHEVEVIVRPPKSGERCPAVIGIDKVMGMEPEKVAAITPFEELEPYYPLKRILMEAPGVHKDISMRAVDLLTPTGFGQRGLIVAPPRTGKTVLMQNMANSVTANFPEAKLILLLIDERPEEVTDFKRHTQGEIVSSTFDESPTNHVHAAEMVIEKARRLVELGQHVVILLDSITRLARAYNALASNSGKIMSGGIEATALQKPKRFFGSARNIEGGGSLTILGTALIDTGSRMDEVIFEEFKGTGNMELHLDRGLSDKRIFPAINIDRSGTRKEELIYHPEEMQRVYGLRRAMQGIPPVEAMEMFITRLRKTKTNAEFLMSLAK